VSAPGNHMESSPERPPLPEWLAELAATLGYERPRAYVTEISLPSSGGSGVHRLFRPMREPEPLPESEPEAGL
jgi:hypothetical protein